MIHIKDDEKDRWFIRGRPMFVAELSCNHEGSIDRAKKLIREAKLAQADAVKFQFYMAEDMTAPSDRPEYTLSDGPWEGRTLWDLYEEAGTPIGWAPELFAYARECGLIPFASVFNVADIGVLEDLDCPAYKIASGEGHWYELIDACVGTGKPVFISDGAGPVREQSGVTVLRCVARYPADPMDYALSDLKTSERWGLSDHSCHLATWSAAVALGATIIEAHLMEEGYTGLDAGHSLTAKEFGAYVHEAKKVGQIAWNTRPPQSREGGLEFERRLVAVTDLPAGTRITPADVRALRASGGSKPYWPVTGRRTLRDIEKWEPIHMDDTEAES